MVIIPSTKLVEALAILTTIVGFLSCIVGYIMPGKSFADITNAEVNDLSTSTLHELYLLWSHNVVTMIGTVITIGGVLLLLFQH